MARRSRRRSTRRTVAYPPTFSRTQRQRDSRQLEQLAARVVIPRPLRRVLFRESEQKRAFTKRPRSLTVRTRLIKARPVREQTQIIIHRTKNGIKPVIQRARVPARVFRKPTRIRSALVRAVQRRSSKRPQACKCSNERSEAQRVVTRRFIAGYGGRKNMTKKIGACSCH